MEAKFDLNKPLLENKYYRLLKSTVYDNEYTSKNIFTFHFKRGTTTIDEFYEFWESLIDHILSETDENDTVKICFHSAKLMKPVETPFMLKRNFGLEAVLKEFENVIGRKQVFKVTDIEYAEIFCGIFIP